MLVQISDDLESFAIVRTLANICAEVVLAIQSTNRPAPTVEPQQYRILGYWLT